MGSVSSEWSIDPTDLRVEGCRVDWAFTLELTGPARAYLLRIEGDFDLTIDGSTRRHHPGASPASDLGPALAVVHRDVVDLAAHADGRLTATFDDDATLAVLPGEAFEAWTLTGPDGLMIVSLPGGGLSIWSETTRPSA